MPTLDKKKKKKKWALSNYSLDFLKGFKKSDDLEYWAWNPQQ